MASKKAGPLSKVAQAEQDFKAARKARIKELKKQRGTIDRELRKLGVRRKKKSKK